MGYPSLLYSSRVLLTLPNPAGHWVMGMHSPEKVPGLEKTEVLEHKE